MKIDKYQSAHIALNDAGKKVRIPVNVPHPKPGDTIEAYEKDGILNYKVPEKKP